MPGYTLGRQRLATMRAIITSSGPDDQVLADLDQQLKLFGSDGKAEAVSLLGRYMSGAVFWKVLHRHWTGFDAINHAAFEHLFNKHRLAWREEFLCKDDAEVYASLPPTVHVFRGQCQRSSLGLSWTTDREIAADFARGHRGLLNSEPVIYEMAVRKQDVAGVYSDRSEAEVVLFAVQGRLASISV